MASKTDSTKVMWRVQVRKSRNHAWRNMGLYETRSNARAEAAMVRASHFEGEEEPIGFANTRVVRHVRGGGR